MSKKKKTEKRKKKRTKRKDGKKMTRRPFEPGFIDMENLGLKEPDALRQMREMAEAIEKPYRDHLRMLENIAGPSMRAREFFEEPVALKALRRQATFVEGFLKAMEPYRQHQSTMEQLLAAFQPRTTLFQDVMAYALRPSSSMAFLADAERILKSFRIDRVTEAGFTVNGEDISFDEAEEELEQAWAATKGLPSSQRVAATRKKLGQALKASALLALIYYIIRYIVGSTFESPIQTIMDPATVPRAEMIRNWLQENVPSIWLPTPDRRTVVRSSIDLRLTHRRNSTKRGTLYEGDEVEVLDKKKDWTLVVSVDDPNLGGWVFTRYLEKLPPKP